VRLVWRAKESAVTTLTAFLAFAAGLSCGFILGRVFERLEFTRKGYRLPKENK